ncbi:MAG: Ig-like domain-containing protein, partial [Candidatus Angelobacter sp.]
LDTDTNAYLTGIADFQSPNAVSNFPVTPGAFQQKFGGGAGDAFVAKVVSLCALSTVNRTVTICSPGNGSTVASPVRIIAGTTDVTPVKLTQVYLDGKKIYEAPLSAINVGLPIAAGTHRLTVQGLDTAGVFFKKPISINVSPH